MKKWMSLLVAVIMICALGLSALAEGQTGGSDGSTSAAQAGIPIELRASPTTGYDWVITYSQDGIAHLEGEFVLDTVEEGVYGTGGRYEYVLVGDQAGQVDITMRYQFLNDKDEFVDSMMYSILVDKELNVHIIGITAGEH